MDFNSAKAAFEYYLNGYDRENDKVKLKVVHTYGVVSESIPQLISYVHDAKR